jgi:transcriptional regulator with XRE-family HTH domain
MVRRRRLAAELRRLREAAGLTCDDVAERLDCSASKISRIETGRVAVSPRDVRDMLAVYGVNEDQRAGLIQLARDARQKGWWQGYGDTVEPHMATYLAMVSEASQIRHYSVTRIPSLLQAEDYARALVTGGRAGPDRYSGPADRNVEMQMERQRRAAASVPQVWAVLDEGAVRRQVGGRDVMRKQIEHLIGLSAMPQFFLQLIPFTSGAYPALDLPFVILGFPDPADLDVVGIGYATGSLWIEDLADVGRYNVLFDQLQAVALSPADSVALMASALADL